MSKTDGSAPQTDSNDTTTEGAVRVGVVDSVSEPSPQVESYKLTPVKEEDVPTTGFTALEVVADGTFRDSNGEILRTGDVRMYNSVDAKALLETKVSGKPAFKAL